MAQQIQPVSRLRLDHVLNEGPTLLELATQAVAKRWQENPNLDLSSVVFGLKKSWDDFVLALQETPVFPLALKLDKDMQASVSLPEIGDNVWSLYNVPEHVLKTIRHNAAKTILLSFQALSKETKSNTPAYGIYAIASMSQNGALLTLAVTIAKKVDKLAMYMYENKNHLTPSLNLWFDNAENTTELSSFKELSLSSGNLQVLHPALLRMPCLVRLDLRINCLNHLPGWLQATRLTQLRTLNLAANILFEIPQPLFRFTQLKTLNLSSNLITEIPSALNYCKELEAINLGKNQISVISEEFFCLTKLTWLCFLQNKIATISPTISKLSALERFSISDNPVQTIPYTMKQLTKLQILILPKQLKNSIHEGFFAETVTISYV